MEIHNARGNPCAVPSDYHDPAWSEAHKVHDWRWEVPSQVQLIWSTLSAIQRAAIASWAQELADNQNWDD
jgi:hypothetical protein